ncbi:MAG: hypothetical protein ABW164_08080 [Sphingobium sp.]
MISNFSRVLTAILIFAASTMPAGATIKPPAHGTHKTDTLHSRLIMRIDAAEAKVKVAHKAGGLSATKAGQLRKQLAKIRVEAAGCAKQQGFLSAGESASYHRMLDDIERKIA